MVIAHKGKLLLNDKSQPSLSGNLKIVYFTHIVSLSIFIYMASTCPVYSPKRSGGVEDRGSTSGIPVTTEEIRTR